MKKNILLYEDHIDKDIVRDDILAEIYDRLNEMSVEEVIALRNKIFKDEKPEIEFKPSEKKPPSLLE